MFVAMNRFQVKPGKGEVFESAWSSRQSYLDQVPGFVSFRLLKGEDDVFISYSTWVDENAFEAWTDSDAFAQAHRQRLPEGTLAGHPQLSCFQEVLVQQAKVVEGAD